MQRQSRDIKKSKKNIWCLNKVKGGDEYKKIFKGLKMNHKLKNCFGKSVCGVRERKKKKRKKKKKKNQKSFGKNYIQV